MFDLNKLKFLASEHKTLFTEIAENIDTWITDKDIYNYINNFIIEHKLKKAFPIGISINHIIAHDSWHLSNTKNLMVGDFIKIDVGFIDDGNIIDSARTFLYKKLYHKAINDCTEIANQVEKFIENEILVKNLVRIQDISKITNELIEAAGYNALDFLGGHTIEYGKVHGKHFILNKPLFLLPASASNFVDTNAVIGPGEMFAIEIYLPEIKANGNMIQSITIPITHYELNAETITDNKLLIKLSNKETTLLNKLQIETNGLAYEHNIHTQYDKNIVNALIQKNFIIKHYPLEFKSNTKNKIKFVQYEDCFLITTNHLINLTNDY